MKIGIVRETYDGELRVALVPAHVQALTKAGCEVYLEKGAGVPAGYPDAEYESKGVKIEPDRTGVLGSAGVVLTVRAAAANPEKGRADLEAIGDGAAVVGMLDPYQPHEGFSVLAKKRATAFALELLPRITRAQAMDVLSSMANLAGYKAVVLAAELLPRMFPMMMTAAGTVVPARVLVIGAGVAGLQAVATAKRLGAVVSAYDVRAAVKDQVRSLGAKFVELNLGTGSAEGSGGYAKAMDEEFYRRQQEAMTAVLAENDVVITTAAIPGKPSPVLVTEAMVKGMPPGSVIVDLAAERGGNCELTEAGKTVRRHGVTIHGPLNLAATLPFHASQLYSKNITTFLLSILKDGKLAPEADDEIATATMIIRNGEFIAPAIKQA